MSEPPPIGVVLEPMRAVQVIAMLALEPPAHVAGELRAMLTASAGLDDAAIDELVGQARTIMAPDPAIAALVRALANFA